METVTKFDVADYLQTKEDIAGYLNAVFEDGDPKIIATALGNVSRAKGMTNLSKETGITRDGLYKALSKNGNPSLDTLQKIMQALGLQLKVEAVAQEDCKKIVNPI